MKDPNGDILLQIEALLHKRLALLKQYPSLSVEAMQLLENRDISGFDSKLDQRSELTSQVDEITNVITSLVSTLDQETGSIIAGILSSGGQTTDCPPWTSGITRSMERMYKLLHTCALFDAKLLSYANTVQADIRNKLAGVHIQKKIETSYKNHQITYTGMHDNLNKI